MAILYREAEELRLRCGLEGLKKETKMSSGPREIRPVCKVCVQKGCAANLCCHLVSQDTEMTKEELTPHLLF